MPGRLGAGLRGNRPDSGRRRLRSHVHGAGGDWEYKVALNHSWDENYGANSAHGHNILLSLARRGTVKFDYDHKTHWVTDNRQRADRHGAGQLPVRARLPRRLAARLPALVAPGPRRRRHLHVRDAPASRPATTRPRSPSTRAGTRTTAPAAARRRQHPLHRLGAEPARHLPFDSHHARPTDPGRARRRQQRRVGRPAPRLAGHALPRAAGRGPAGHAVDPTLPHVPRRRDRREAARLRRRTQRPADHRR